MKIILITNNSHLDEIFTQIQSQVFVLQFKLNYKIRSCINLIIYNHVNYYVIIQFIYLFYNQNVYTIMFIVRMQKMGGGVHTTYSTDICSYLNVTLSLSC